MARPDPIHIDEEVFTEDPADVTARIQRAARTAAPDAIAEHLASGRTIFYEDPAYPDHIVQECPNGQRFLVEVSEDSTLQVLREIPPR